MIDAPSEYIRIGKVAKWLDVHQQTVKGWCDKGWIACIRYKVGNKFHRQIERKSLMEFVEKHFRPKTAEPERTVRGRRPIYKRPVIEKDSMQGPS